MYCTMKPEEQARMYKACCSGKNQVEQNRAFEDLDKKMYLFAYSMLKKNGFMGSALSERALDCKQNALQKVWRELANCREPERFCHWAGKILSNEVLQFLRNEKRLTTLSLDNDDDIPTPEPTLVEQFDQKELRSKLIHSMAEKLSDRSKVVVYGTFIEGKSDTELAKERSQMEQKEVRNSHIAVTRFKNLQKLRNDNELSGFLN